MRKDFNWSLLDRDTLYSMLYSAGSGLIGKKVVVKDEEDDNDDESEDVVEETKQQSEIQAK